MTTQQIPGILEGYKYRGLPTSPAIRVLQILPELVNDKIVIEMRTIDITDKPTHDYEALSYMWGDPKWTRSILLKDKDGPQMYTRALHESLWQFLNTARRLRMFDKLLWTDSLCLNQRDENEIAQQVPMMGQIYSKAEQVTVWLGNDPGLEHGLHRILDWHGPFDWDLMNHADDLLRLPYWRRVWIVQEIVLARRIIVMCGEVRVSLSSFHTKLSQLQFGESDNRTEGFWRIYELRQARGKWPLWRILHEFWRWKSTKRLDRVYGFLGLASYREDLEIDSASPVEFIQVDYNKDNYDLYLDTVLEIRAPWNIYRKIAVDLGYSLRTGTIEDSSFEVSQLVKYVENEGISKRHVTFGSIALQTFEAMNFLQKALLGADNVAHLSGQLANVTEQSIPDDLQNSAWVGLVLWTRQEEFRQWRRSRGRNMQSPWRCQVHQLSPTNPSRSTQSSPIIGFLMTTTINGRKDFRNVCGSRQYGTCDVSALSYQVPDVDFKLEIQPQANAEDARMDGFCFNVYTTV